MDLLFESETVPGGSRRIWLRGQGRGASPTIASKGIADYGLRSQAVGPTITGRPAQSHPS